MKSDTVVMSMMGVIVTGWVAGYIASALGKGRAAQTIDLITNLLCFTTAVGTVAGAINAFRKLVN